MALEPTSSPTTDLFFLKSSIGLALDRHLVGTPRPHIQDALTLFFHPSVQKILLEPPTIPQLESHTGNPVFVQILVEGVRRDPQVLRGLPQCHHFLGFFHVCMPCLSLSVGYNYPFNTPSYRHIWGVSIGFF